MAPAKGMGHTEHMHGADPRRYHEWKIVRYHRWLERRTLTQYALLNGVYNSIAAAALIAVVWWLVPHSLLGPYPLIYPLVAMPALTVAMTAQQTWQRRNALRQNRDGTRQQGN